MFSIVRGKVSHLLGENTGKRFFRECSIELKIMIKLMGRFLDFTYIHRESFFSVQKIDLRFITEKT